MAKLAPITRERKNRTTKEEVRRTAPHGNLAGAPPGIDAYAASLRKMTNSQVSSQGEFAASLLTPAAEIDENLLWRIRVLFDELRWRLSELE
jgi:hypothetical protein